MKARLHLGLMALNDCEAFEVPMKSQSRGGLFARLIPSLLSVYTLSKVPPPHCEITSEHLLIQKEL